MPHHKGGQKRRRATARNPHRNALPSLPQILDPTLPILGANLHLDILEDSLFAHGREYLLPAFQRQGARHHHQFKRFAAIHGAYAPVEPCLFSSMPFGQRTTAFFEKPELLQLGPSKLGALSRSQVMWSFTGDFPDLLRERKVIPYDARYLVVEPFHHFTEIGQPNVEKPGSPAGRMMQMTRVFFRNHPYGSGPNAGVQGGIAFVPSMNPAGLLCFENTSKDHTCHQGNVESFLASRRSLVAQNRVPALSADWLFADG